jgi:hypothetical protein
MNGVRRFQQEARAASSLNHPNIVTVYEIGQAGDLHYIATEYVEGETLRAILKRGAAALPALLEILAQVADGLAKAHSAGIVHRDLKPENIMVTVDGFAKVLDFGLAKLLETQKPSSADSGEAPTVRMDQTQSGAVMGTAGYMSPEQAQGKLVDHQSDIFSFGCILYEAATGHQPFEAETKIDVLHKLIHEIAPPVSEFNPRCPAELQRIMRKCMAKDTNKRYQSIKDVAIDLRELTEEYELHSSSQSAQAFAQSGAIARTTDEELTSRATEIEPTLSDSDPEALHMTRFTKVSAALVILGLISAIAIWPLYRRWSVYSDFKMEYPREVALRKAHEIVKSFGYDSTGLQERIFYDDKTDFDLEYVAAQQGGVEEARRAVREGETAQWEIFFIKSKEELPTVDKLRLGEFSIVISPRGRLVSFATPPKENEAITPLEKEQAIKKAEEIARRMFSLDLSGYEVEFIQRSNPASLVEITWRNRGLVLGHRETVRASLQGDKLIRLGRSLEALQTAKLPSKENHWLLEGILSVRTALLFSLMFVIAALAVVYLIRNKRWNALREKLPIIASALLALALGVFTFLQNQFYTDLTVILVINTIIVPAIIGCPSFIVFAGLFDWLRAVNPARLYGMDQLVKGRLFSHPTASSLVHGIQGGALMMGLESVLWVFVATSQQELPILRWKNSIFQMVAIGPLGSFSASLALWIVLALILAVFVELVEKMMRGQILRALIPALFYSFMTSVFITGVNFRVLAAANLLGLLETIIMIQLYRSRGLLAMLISLIVFSALWQIVIAHHLGDSGIAFQANAILLVMILLQAAGVWGYVREYVQKQLPALGIK